MSVIAEIKDKLDIVSYIGQFVQLKQAGRYHKGLCPFHNEKTPSFMVSPDRQTWHCYGACGVGGDVLDFAMRYHGWTLSEAIDELAKAAGIEIKRGSYRKHERLYGLLDAAAEAFQRVLWSKPAEEVGWVQEYLSQRGLQEKTVREFGIGYHPGGWRSMLTYLKSLGYTPTEVIAAGLAYVPEGKNMPVDRLRSRLIFPIRDARGRVVAFAGRRLDGKSEAKYINTPSTAVFHRDQILYGYDRRAITGTVVIVEGYMDVIQAHQAGFTNVVAQMGTALTDAQTELLQTAETIVLAFDGDAAGQQAIRANLEQAIKGGRDVRILTLPDGLDPDNIIADDPDVWAALVAEAVPVADYLLETEFSQLPANAPIMQRERLVRDLLPILMATESDIYRRDSLQKLAAYAGIPFDQIIALAGPPAPKSRPPVVQKVKQAPLSPIEAYCLRAMLQDDQLYVAAIRAFRELGLEDFDEQDFIDLRPIVSLYLQSFTQFDLDPPDYVRTNLDETMLPMLDELGTEPVNEKAFVQNALRLRRQRLEHEIEMLTQQGSDMDAIRKRQQARARIISHP